MSDLPTASGLVLFGNPGPPLAPPGSVIWPCQRDFELRYLVEIYSSERSGISHDARRCLVCLNENIFRNEICSCRCRPENCLQIYGEEEI